MQRKFFLKYFWFIFSMFSHFSSAINPVHVVFRTDDRALPSLRQDGGMWPWKDGHADDDLAHHFEGESIEGRRSNFVSTTASLRIAIMHAASLARANSEEPFDEDFVTYIYQIRPADNFYSVDEALQTARDSSAESSSRRERLTRLINDYTGMEEYVAHGGFNQNRIISYAELTGDMLMQYYNEHSSALFTQSFWNSRWLINTDYNHDFDSDTTSVATYANIDNPTGLISQIINGTQPPVPLSFTCMGLNSSIGKRKDRLFFPKNTCGTQNHLAIKKIIYDKQLIALLSNL